MNVTTPEAALQAALDKLIRSTLDSVPPGSDDRLPRNLRAWMAHFHPEPTDAQRYVQARVFGHALLDNRKLEPSVLTLLAGPSSRGGPMYLTLLDVGGDVRAKAVAVLWPIAYSRGPQRDKAHDLLTRLTGNCDSLRAERTPRFGFGRTSEATVTSFGDWLTLERMGVSIRPDVPPGYQPPRGQREGRHQAASPRTRGGAVAAPSRPTPTR